MIHGGTPAATAQGDDAEIPPTDILENLPPIAPEDPAGISLGFFFSKSSSGFDLEVLLVDPAIFLQWFQQ